MNGYSHPGYAASLAEFGMPLFLPHSNGWLLERSIPDTTYLDAMGCYPLFACNDWSQLHVDLDELRGRLVSVAIVADPFGDHNLAQLNHCFPDQVIPFKEHLITDLSQPPDAFVGPQHRRKARRALERLHVEHCEDATPLVDEWNDLYANLIQRHAIGGLTTFSASSFRSQLAVPGMFMFRATFDNQTVGMTLWYVDRGVAYYHLGAYSDLGYELAASFALFWFVLHHFANHGLEWLNLGAGAGLSREAETDGLTRFKRGWANGTRTAYFCGRILDQKKYEEVMKNRRAVGSDYFPAYRKGEFS